MSKFRGISYQRANNSREEEKERRKEKKGRGREREREREIIRRRRENRDLSLEIFHGCKDAAGRRHDRGSRHSGAGGGEMNGER